MAGKEQGRSGLGWVLWLAAFSPVIYIASIGPVAWATTRLGIEPERVRPAYMPLVWLHDNTPMQKPLEWYVELFGVR